MSSEDKNFRYGYYEKVGFGAIEEKKSLEILLREKPPDLLARLAQLASRYSLSAGQRKQVWQLLLDVIRPDDRISDIRCTIGRQIFNDIERALRLMGVIVATAQQAATAAGAPDYQTNPNMTSPSIVINDTEHAKMIVLIYLFEMRELRLTITHQLQKAESNDLLALADTFLKEFYQISIPYAFEDTYCIFKNFISLINSNLGALIETYEKFIQNLANEDATLHNHLETNGIIQCQDHKPNANAITYRHEYMIKNKIVHFRPIITWFVRFFTGIIHQNFVIRILDKVIGCLITGSRPFYILISTSKIMMMYLRPQLLLADDAEQLQNLLLMPLSIEDSEQIVNRAMNN